MHEVLGRVPRELERGLMRSTFWLDANPGDGPSTKQWLWSVGPGVRCEWVSINGDRVPWVDRDATIALEWSPAGAPAQVEIWSSFTFPPSPEVDERGMVERLCPKWLGGGTGALMIADAEGDLSAGDARSDVDAAHRARADACLTSLEQMLGMRSGSARREGSQLAGERGRWIQFFAWQSFDALRDWALHSRPSSDPMYSDAVERWVAVLQIEPQLKFEAMPIQPWDWKEAVAEAAPPNTKANTPWTPASLDRWVATLTMALTLVLSIWFWQNFQDTLLRSPWWLLGAIGGWLWILSGSLIPAVVLLTIGWLLAIDTYWILSERFRQTGLRGPR